jgi:hypothetical protein
MPAGGIGVKVSAVVLGVFVLVSGFALAVGPAAADEPMNFRAVLAGENEVPPRDTLGRGVAVLQLHGSTLSWRLIASNIDNVFAAHIHCGVPGVNGPVRVPLFNGPVGGGRFSGVLSTGSADISSVTCPDGTSLLSNILAGQTYVNVHTNDGIAPTNQGPGDFPGGEIRGLVF